MQTEYDDIDTYNYSVKQSNARTSTDDEYASVMREERVRTLLAEIDPSNLVDSIIYRLRGYRYDKLKEHWVKRKDAVEISENFIQKVEYILSEELSLNTTFSNLDTADVNKVMEFLIEILTSDVVVHGRNYYVLKAKSNSFMTHKIIINKKGFQQVVPSREGDVEYIITSLADDHNLKEVVLFGIFSAVYKAMRRSIRGTEAKRFFGSLRMNETISPPQQKKGGIFEAFKSMGN